MLPGQLLLAARITTARLIRATVAAVTIRYGQSRSRHGPHRGDEHRRQYPHFRFHNFLSELSGSTSCAHEGALHGSASLESAF
jgi:hypothetical protein